MRLARLAAAALLALSLPVQAQQSRPTAQLNPGPLPLNLNLGGGLNSRQGAAVFDLFGAVQNGVNALQAARGAPNGIAVLDQFGYVPLSQLPPYYTTFNQTGIGPLNVYYAGRSNQNAIIAGSGNSVSFCPALSCIVGPPGGPVTNSYLDHQRTSLLVSAVTQDDAHSEEQTVGITTTVGTGYAPNWRQSTAYSLGANVSIGNAVYRATTAGVSGTTAPPGTRPASLPYTFQDGSITWLWINDQAIAAKLGLYNEVQCITGAGQCWAQANNLQLQPGMVPTFNVATEVDLTNNSGSDCAIGVSNCLGVYIHLAGTNQNTSALSIDAGTTSDGRPGSVFGMRISGTVAAKETVSLATTNGESAIGIGTFGPASYSVASINDASTSPAALNVDGTKSLADIRAGASSPRGLYLQGAKSIAAIDDASTSPAGLNISGAKSIAAVRVAGPMFNGLDLTAGSYTGSQIAGIGFSVSPTGVVTGAGFMSGGNTGQTCSGPPSAIFAVTNGIVTRC